MFLPLALTLVALVVLPDQVPMHYDVAGNINRWGSKYENLILPGVTLGMGVLYILLCRYYGKKGDERSVTVLWIFGSCMLAVFNVMTAVLLFQAYRAAVEGSAGMLEISRVLFTVTGLVFMPLGNLIPKLRRNGLIGVRTAWSRESDENWRMSQVAGGIGFMVTGAALVVGNLFFVREEQSLVFSIFAILLIVPVVLLALLVMKMRKTEGK